MLVRTDYAQVYGGPTYTPVNWFQVGLGGGFEQVDDPWPWRLGGYAWAGFTEGVDENRSVFSTVHILETSPSGFWYRGQFNYPLSDNFGLGALGEMYMGLGPRVEYCLPQTPLQFSLAPLYDLKIKQYNWAGATFNW